MGRVVGNMERPNDIVFARKGKSSLVTHSVTLRNATRLHGTLLTGVHGPKLENFPPCPINRHELALSIFRRHMIPAQT